ncbi:MAG: YceI family protein [Myxococcales bacterium]
MRLLICAALVAAAAEAPQTFDLRAGTLTYAVVHKLHQVKGSTHAVEGRALLKPDGTLRVQVRAKIASFDSGNGNRDEHVREVTHEPAHPFVQVKGSAKGLPVPLAAPADFTLEATLELNGVQKQQAIPVHLEPKDGAVRAKFSFPISLDAFRVERPQLLFVKVDDKAQIEGDLVFGAAK